MAHLLPEMMGPSPFSAYMSTQGNTAPLPPRVTSDEPDVNSLDQHSQEFTVLWHTLKYPNSTIVLTDKRGNIHLYILKSLEDDFIYLNICSYAVCFQWDISISRIRCQNVVVFLPQKTVAL